VKELLSWSIVIVIVTGYYVECCNEKSRFCACIYIVSVGILGHFLQVPLNEFCGTSIKIPLKVFGHFNQNASKSFWGTSVKMSLKVFGARQ
jgi:hypothetical protein